jgi:preprotein translocase subunit SecG
MYYVKGILMDKAILSFSPPQNNLLLKITIILTAIFFVTFVKCNWVNFGSKV